MAYQPRGTVKVILDHMATAEADVEWSTEELAQAGGVDKRSVATTMKTALRHECLYAERRGRYTWYSLTPFAREPEEEVEPVPFNARRWMDGDIDLYGLLETEDGAMRLSADKVGSLLQLLGGIAP